MKTPTFLRSGLLLLAGLAAATAIAADEFKHVYITHVRTATDSAGRWQFADGDTRMTVLGQRGEPHHVLAPDVWIYCNQRAINDSDAENHGCRDLVVYFAPGSKYHEQKVAAMVLTNAAGRNKIEKGLKQNPRYLEDLLTGY